MIGRDDNFMGKLFEHVFDPSHQIVDWSIERTSNKELKKELNNVNKNQNNDSIDYINNIIDFCINHEIKFRLNSDGGIDKNFLIDSLIEHIKSLEFKF